MRVAVCLSGQPRSVEDTFPYIYNNIIVPNNADVFVHLNFDPNNTYIEKSHMDKKNCIVPSNADEIVKNLYNPKRMLVEIPKNFSKPTFNIPENRISGSMVMNKHKNWSEEEHRSHCVKQLFSLYYSIFKCNELKEVYANEHGIVYDYVIRIRFDSMPMSPLDCSKYDPNFIYYQELGQPDNLISEWINFGSNSIMNVYASLYFMTDYLNTFDFMKKSDRQPNTLEPSDRSAGFSEYYIRDLMYLCKIPKQPFNINCGLHNH